MWLDKILGFFVPKDKKFFALFEQAAKNLVAISAQLNLLLNTPEHEKRKEIFVKIKELEHVGDHITHQIMLELSTNFITPFDREDIAYLATTLDDVADYIHGSAKRILLYKTDEITLPMKDLAVLIDQCTVEIDVIMGNLKNLSNTSRIREAVIRIKKFEDDANDVLHPAIAGLFDNEKDAIRLIKYQEILNTLETATDKCDDVANVIETILVKSS